MDEQQRKAMLKKTFDTVAGGYDHPSLGFFAQNVKHLADLLTLRGDEVLLDVATGTGHAALELARHLPRGQVHGIDFSRGMLDRAIEKRDSLGMTHVHFHEMDMQAIEFADGHFDLAVCSFCIFFVEDMAGLLCHLAAKVKPGGMIMATTFAKNLFAPLNDIFLQRIERYGVEVPKLNWRRTASEEKCLELFQAAGMTDIQIHSKDLGYHIPTADQWWDIVWNAGFRGLVEQLSPRQQEAFKSDHLEEVQALAGEEGIRLNIEVLYSLGTVAAG